MCHFRQQQQIVWDGRGGVQDRTIYEDAIFAKMLRDDGLMEEREYQTYLSLFNNMSNFMRKPNVIVYLDVTPEESYERIKMRSRECESSLPLEYLQKLSKAYEDFLEDVSQIIPVLRVNYSQFHTASEMAEQIQREYAKMRSIRDINWGETNNNKAAAAAATTGSQAEAKAAAEAKVMGGKKQHVPIESPPSTPEGPPTAGLSGNNNTVEALVTPQLSALNVSPAAVGGETPQ